MNGKISWELFPDEKTVYSKPLPFMKDFIIKRLMLKKKKVISKEKKRGGIEFEKTEGK